MNENMMKSVKKRIKLQELEIRKFVAEFDPLGIGEGFPEDEYDGLVHNIISILNRKDYSLDLKKGLLIDIFLGYADLSIENKKEVSSIVGKVLIWWQKQSLNT